MEAHLLVLAALVTVFAAFVQGVTGFGFGLLAVGFYTLVFGSKTGVLVLSLVGSVVSVAIFVRVWRHTEWKETLLLAVPVVVVGTPLGLLAFDFARDELLTRIVGALLIVSAVYFLSPWAPRPQRPHPSFAVGAGALAGFLSGLTSTGGPPLVLYLYAREMDKTARLAVLQAVFVIASFAKVAGLVGLGWLTGPIWRDAAILTIPLLVGVYLGQKLFHRIPAEPLRKAALLLLLALGVLLVVLPAPAAP